MCVWGGEKSGLQAGTPEHVHIFLIIGTFSISVFTTEEQNWKEDGKPQTGKEISLVDKAMEGSREA